MLGFGNVGRAFVRFAGNGVPRPAVVDGDIVIAAVADSTGCVFPDEHLSVDRLLEGKEAGHSIQELAGGNAIQDPNALIPALVERGISALVEALPSNVAAAESGQFLMESALLHGINVVTVEKRSLVRGFDSLRRAAAKGFARLAYTGATGVSIPDRVLESTVLEIRGILNGTTNYILSEMQHGSLSFQEALARAQSLGIAEPDPSLDVEGWDTAVKILILAKTLMGATASIDEVSRIGIGPAVEPLLQNGRETGRIVRLAGRARIWHGNVRVSVAPKLIEPDSPFYSVEGTSKAAVFRTKEYGDVFASAESSRRGIAEIIFQDLLDIVRT